MTTSLEQILAEHHSKDEMVAFINEHPEFFEAALQEAISTRPEAWRAAWLLGHCMDRNDARILPYLNKMIAAQVGKNDGHQRELLKVLQKMELNEEHEGRLFTICIDIWEDLQKSPSVRITVFRKRYGLADRYPALKQELAHLSEEKYLGSLSPGIKKSFKKIVG